MKTKKHLKTKVDENHNTVVQTNATKKSDSKSSPVTSYDKQSNRDKELGTTSIIRTYMTVCTQITLLQSSG
jgi:hypothetical protein